MEGHGGEVLGLCGDESGHVWSCGWDKKIFVWDAGVSSFLSALLSPSSHLTTFSIGGQTFHLLLADATHQVHICPPSDFLHGGRQVGAQDMGRFSRRHNWLVAARNLR